MLGMGTVYLFLGILVFAVRGVSRFARFIDSRAAAVKKIDSAAMEQHGYGEESARVAAISAAIAAYRATDKQAH